ncbi:PEP-CTERM sorting domain-containing protein [Ideonella sp. A 288]|uniref:PEP-CTERM sorting domain-containing protein n=1 Tax=Ideonella sp. A 288 TaxID=1962181 RepID=UPI000B4B0C86|nr:PEP-CTERM sorting domain-containing protein [Ideonella sp. A 288]
MSSCRSRPWRAWPAAASTCLCLTLAAALPSARAATLTDVLLSAVPPDSGSASFTAPEAPGWLVTVQEIGSATMVGSDLFGYEGLWLGSPGQGGRYNVLFSQPVSSVSFSFVALTAFFDGGAESLGSFIGNVALSAAFSSVDGSASWNGSVLRALDEDSRAVLTFSTAAAGGLRSIGFQHLQPEPLQGFVIDRIDFAPAPVPEPPALLMLGLGLLGMGLWRRRAVAPSVTVTGRGLS